MSRQWTRSLPLRVVDSDKDDVTLEKEEEEEVEEEERSCELHSLYHINVHIQTYRHIMCSFA